MNLLGNCSMRYSTSCIHAVVRKSHFGQIFRSISLNMNNYSILRFVNGTSLYHYSPRSIEKSDFLCPLGAKWLSLATTAMDGGSAGFAGSNKPVDPLSPAGS